MLAHITARAIIMLGHGITLQEAISWTCRRLPRNLKPYYARQIIRATATI